jgi:serine/threonine-protein kinase/endoribonuclease IRE1
MDDSRHRRPRASAVAYYVLLTALVLAVAGQVVLPHSLAEPDARRRLAPLSAEDAPGARSTPIAHILSNNTNGKYTITAGQQSKADKQQDLAVRSLQGSNVETAALLATRGGTGLAPRTQAQRLEDYELEDIVLLATVDGSLHACDRRTGREKWSLDFPDQPMIETINYERNRSSEGDPASENDYIFIVEPSREGTGNLYIQNKHPSKGGLQKLKTTVQALAANRPHDRIPGTPYSTIASQHSSTYTIDAASGSVLRRQDINSPFVNSDRDRSCLRVDPFNEDSQECEPVGIFVLGRMEYTIIISDANTSEDLCRIKFAEWTINSRNADLQAEHDATPLARRQILSFSNGQIMGMGSGEESGGPKFQAKFDSPVTQVFDVARPLDTKGTSAPLVILTQPVVLSQDAQSLDLYQGVPRDLTKVFVNKTRRGSYFLMSEEQYPFSTTRGTWSKLFQGIDTERTEIDLDSEEDDLTGIHRLDTPFRVPLLEAPSSSQPVKELAPRQEGEVEQLTSNYTTTPNWSFIFNWGLGVFAIASIAMFVFGLSRKNQLCLTIASYVERWTGTHISASPAKQVSSPLESVETKVSSSLSRNMKNEEVATSEDPMLNSPGLSSDPLLQVERAEKRKHNRQDSQKSASDGDSNDAESTENPDFAGVGVNPDEANPAPTVDEDSQPSKKNRQLPRKRGGVKNKKKKAKAAEEMLNNVAQLPEMEATPITGPVHPVSLDGQAAIPDPPFVPELQLESGKTQVGSITVDTRMGTRLGDGSNGTIVFRGEFSLRQVAVKRLIRSPKNFAAAEIKHLPDLDSHPNVIRFFTVQESQNFTWIALDLFKTSLDQVVEHPELHTDLVPSAGLDVNDILCQVARGVEHLHSRRVVHRDIKPQNVLVRLLKPGQQPTTGHPNLQVVLSDFGLCKTLDDGPGSAFAPTGNHTAAGTTGWKAPELLATGSSAIMTVDAGSSGASNPTSTSSEIDGLPGQKLRRPGRSIDIFSMGCLFFYVMTQGGHPFDHGGSYARDFNIKENKSNTRDLLVFHNYTYEADDLILQMISHEPQNRPSATQVLQHPYFWPTERKLQFLCDVSDCYEREKVAQIDKADPRASTEEIDALEAIRENVWTGDFLKRLPSRIITEAGKQRKYTGTRMIDLLRLIRNKKHHFHDLPDDIKFGEMEGTQEGYYRFWSGRFPSLMVNLHCLIIERELKDNPDFMELRKYFE